jgi:hypothetical protein
MRATEEAHGLCHRLTRDCSTCPARYEQRVGLVTREDEEGKSKGAERRIEASLRVVRRSSDLAKKCEKSRHESMPPSPSLL